MRENKPNNGARVLATGRAHVLGFAFADLRRPYFAELAHEFSQAASKHGCRVFITETEGTAKGEEEVFADARSGLVDGVILHFENRNGAEVAALRGTTPTVFLGEAEPSAEVDHVSMDNVPAAVDAVNHLYSLGRRHIAFLGHEQGILTRTSALRLESYRQALTAHELPLDPRLEISRSEPGSISAETALGAVLDREPAMDAILCRDDLAAIGTLRALRTRNIPVPESIAVIGWDSIGLASSLTPTLTSVAEAENLAATALELLLERINGHEGPARHTTIRHHINKGESTP
ncbi:LacI family transcriptional regulator [Arthrobacter cheniae]|uniref:LacI family transcriptional regulator n=1 Tax=Arthrobacter cheniae TaxID=1258888 RepID=A0A3A5M6I0_9MICC|nr:substrate-binding domain-containing protein [Arthrobacter cheniae]RJT75636.1 LacI family transcriptional regulator [Arthrobacter cheniae]